MGELDNKKGWALNHWCFWTVVLEKTLESPLDCKEIKPVNPKGNWPWILSWRWSSNTLAWCKEPMHWKRPWCCERLRAGGEGDDRGWDGWMASLTQWTWVWASSRRWWRTGKPGVLQSMGEQRAGQNLAAEHQQHAKGASTKAAKLNVHNLGLKWTPFIFNLCHKYWGGGSVSLLEVKGLSMCFSRLNTRK